MEPTSRPSFIDIRLLAAIERAFEHHGGGQAGIDVAHLQQALGLRSEYLARRVHAAFDQDGDGVIAKDEFVRGVRKLIFGSDRDKLLFAFRVHDHNGDGYLDQQEITRMVAISLAESEVAEKASQPAERLAATLFLAADRDRDGRVSFEEFVEVISRRPALLRRMTRSEAQWILPNEDLLAWLDGPKPARPGRLRRFLENRFLPSLFVTLWIAANLAVFGVSLGKGLAHGQDPLTQVGRALGACLDLNGALILVPVMRRLLGWVRSTRLHRVVPIDDAVTFHRMVGHSMLFFGVAHSAVIAAAYGVGHPRSSLSALLFETARGLTGLLLLVIIAIMWTFSLPVIRRSSRFELFYFTHLLYLAWLGLSIAHGPPFLLFAGVPILGFLVEQILRLRRRALPTTITAGEALRSGVTQLSIARPKGFTFSPGDYVFLRIPAIARHEWHPFTLSSAPESDALTVHVRSLGNWTAALRRFFEDRRERGEAGPVPVHVDGPYGSPSAHIFDSTHAVLIGAGIGVTPFASVLGSLVLRALSERPAALRKAHFFWLNRDQYSFEWFAALLRSIEELDDRQLLDVHLCMTNGRAGITAMGLELARELMHSAGRTDIVTGLRTHTHMGQPDWEAMLGAIAARHVPEPVDVYFCGPPGLGKKLAPLCEKLGMRFREEQF
ncbi:MAG: EF-hand domain-containing protein [Byssovorax sp.]